MKLILIGLFACLGWTRLPGDANQPSHAIYISVLEIKQGLESKEGSVRIKVFVQDFEDAIFNHSSHRLNFSSGNSDSNKELISAYFYDSLKIDINNNALKYNYVSCEVNDISLWLNFAFEANDNWQQMKVSANYFMELFPTQSNVVSITYHEQKRMFRLTKAKSEEVVEFD